MRQPTTSTFRIADVLLTLAIIPTLGFFELGSGNQLAYGRLSPGQIGFLEYVLVAIVWSGVLHKTGVYVTSNRLSATLWPRLAVSTAICVLLLVGVLTMVSGPPEQAVAVKLWVADFGLLLAFRILADVIVGRRAKPRRVVIVGESGLADDVADAIRRHSHVAMEIVGFAHAHEGNTNGNHPPRRVIPVSEVPAFTALESIDDVVLALPASQHDLVLSLALELQRKPVTVWMVPDVRELCLTTTGVQDFGGMPMLNLRAPAIDGINRALKRGIDLVGASTLIILFLPVMLVIALLIKLSSPGPVIFKQTRIGEGCRPFTMYKFRTMYGLAQRKALQATTAHKVRNDPRVTPVGHYIRQWSLDELPQFFNVLLGNMSLVGPRPELPELVASYDRWQYRRFTVPQGITGLWQVSGRSDRPMHLHTEDDLTYVSQYSPLADLKIIARTVGAVLSRRGAF